MKPSLLGPCGEQRSNAGSLRVLPRNKAVPASHGSGPCQGRESISPRLKSLREGAFLFRKTLFVMTSLIGLYSSAPQSGKTLIANILAQKSYRLMSFAEPIKRMAVEFIMSLGYTRDQAVKLAWDHKEKEIPEIKKTARYILQTLGTEWGRECISTEIWTECMMHRIALCLKDKSSKIVIDDVRFANEAEMIKKMGGELWMIVRPSAVKNTSHKSEGGLDQWNQFDHIILNDGTIADAYQKINEIIKC